jgi:hypothetical protein
VPAALWLIEGVKLTLWLPEKHTVRVKAALVGMGLKEMLELVEEEMELVSLIVYPALCDALCDEVAEGLRVSVAVSVKRCEREPEEVMHALLLGEKEREEDAELDGVTVSLPVSLACGVRL